MFSFLFLIGVSGWVGGGTGGGCCISLLIAARQLRDNAGVQNAGSVPVKIGFYDIIKASPHDVKPLGQLFKHICIFIYNRSYIYLKASPPITFFLVISLSRCVCFSVSL